MVLTAVFLLTAQCVAAFSLDPDSIAKRSRFSNFCVKTYRWADRFFNGVDTAYVKSTGYKWNVKLKSGSWSDINEFFFDRNERMKMQSPYCSTIGFDIQYLAVALGYDININKLMGGADLSKSRFNFEISSALMSGKIYYLDIKDGMTIKRFGDRKNISLDYKAMKTSTRGIDATYYFNHRRYSNSAAFSFGKIQRQSQGSFMLTVAYQSQKMKFDFARMPDEVKEWLPDEWKDKVYLCNGHSLGIGGGYGFNWVPCRNLTIGIMGEMIPNVSYGYLNSANKACSFGLNYRGGLSMVWNNDRFFIGGTARADGGFIFSNAPTLTNVLVNFDLKIGWRFNLF